MESLDQNIKNNSISEPLRKTVLAILSRAGLDGCELIRDENSQIGLNFMGSIVELVARNVNGTDLNIVAKCGIKNKAFYKRFGARISYEIEHYMYEKFIPALCEFQFAKISPERVCPHVGKYYGAFLDNYYEEVFVFENLKKLNFKTLNSKMTLDVPHVEIVLQELAHYHAACFAFKDQKATEWAALVLNNENIGRGNYFFRNNQLEEIALHRFKKLVKVFEDEGELELATHLGAFADNINEYVKGFTGIDRHSIIYHGDVWCSNVMFKYGDTQSTNHPTEIKLIDWQASRLGHLCIDLCYFLYMSASTKILGDLDRYLKFYYAQFCERIRVFGSDPHRLFPYDSFMKQWRVCTPYALIVISNVLIANYMEPDEFPDFIAVAESGGNIYRCVDVDFRRIADYNKRMKTLVKLSVERKSF